jgi:hypothetical protein
MMITSQALLTWRRSRGADIDLHIGAVHQHVVDSGTPPGLLDERAQLFRRRVAVDIEVHTDLPVAVANSVGEPKDAEQVNVTLDGGGDPPQGDASGRGNVCHACRNAGGDRMQQKLDRRWAVVRSHEDRRVIGVVAERDRAGRVLLSSAVEALNG